MRRWPNAGGEELSLAWAKRFVELWVADPDFRQQVPLNPAGAFEQAGLQLDPQEVQSMWLPGPSSPLLQQCSALAQQRQHMRQQLLQANAPGHPGWRLWRERQMRRCQRELESATAEAIMHVPLAIELSSGCSVGCWFCGLSADSLRGHFLATPANVDLWRQVLTAFARQRQSGARGGICYWATDPLDNPDYERWCQDFHAILGHFPHTTTALALRDLPRTRRLLELSRQHEGWAVRFSILSLAQLKKVHASFRPEELLGVDLILQHAQAPALKARAGRAAQPKGSAQARQTRQDAELSSTIACVSGFLVNMVERTLLWVSPCNAGPRWPLGYRIHARATFADAAEFEQQLQAMLNSPAMAERLPLEAPLQWRQGRPPQNQIPGFAAWEALSQALTQGERSASELAVEFEDRWGTPMAETVHVLNQLYELALLEDEFTL